MVWVAQVSVTVYGAKDVNNKVFSDFTMTCTAKRKTCLTNVEKGVNYTLGLSVCAE